jgi:ribosomal protein L30E
MNKLDIERELKKVISTGKMYIGMNQAVRAMEESVAIVIAKDCYKREEIAKSAGEKAIFYDGDSISLGNACGKPFSASVVSIIDRGKSNWNK